MPRRITGAKNHVLGKRSSQGASYVSNNFLRVKWLACGHFVIGYFRVGCGVLGLSFLDAEPGDEDRTDDAEAGGCDGYVESLDGSCQPRSM